MDVNPKYSNPQGEEGLAALEEMNRDHRPLSEWALAQLPSIAPGRILDIGCGGGMMISLLAERYPGAEIVGIDISDEAVGFASKINSGIISEGRCRIMKASVADLPFGDGTFDLVVSCESYFFWPDLEHDLGEACRMLSEKGVIAITSEAYPDPRFEEINERHSRTYGMRLVENPYMEELFKRLGMNVRTTVVKENNWVIFAAGKDPSFSF